MPTYDYRCAKCGAEFTRILSLKEHDEKQKCPQCGSQQVVQLLSVFIPKTSRKA